MQALESPLTFSKSSLPKYSVNPPFHYPQKQPNIYGHETLPHSDIAELFFSVWQNHEITEANRKRLKFALSSYQELNESDHRLIDRLLHAVKRGWITMKD